MKKLLFSLIILVLSGCHSTKYNTDLFLLFKNKQFQKLESANNNLKAPLYYFYKSVVSSVCNNLNESNLYLDSLQFQSPELPDSLSYEIIKLRNDNYIKLFDYPNAYKTATVLTTKYRSYIKPDDVEDEINAAKIWKAIEAQKPQRISSFNKASIPLIIDLAQLPNIDIESNGKKMNFVFDTGAGISSIQESLKAGSSLLTESL